MKFKLRAENEIGSTLSDDYIEAMLISKPAAPSNTVQKVLSTKSSIVVEMPMAMNNGGSTLTNYELLADDGAQSELAVIYSGLNRTVEI